MQRTSQEPDRRKDAAHDLKPVKQDLEVSHHHACSVGGEGHSLEQGRR